MRGFFLLLFVFLSVAESFFVVVTPAPKLDVPHLKALSLGSDHHYVLTVWGFSSR